MMEVYDQELETKKFKMYAETADTPERRIELCKKYLKAKGIDVDAILAHKVSDTWSQMKDQYATDFGNPKYHPNIVSVVANETVDLDSVRYKIEPDLIQMLHKQTFSELTHQIAKADLVSFDTWEDVIRRQYTVRASINVWKGKVR